jgi:hypothetical protein
VALFFVLKLYLLAFSYVLKQGSYMIQWMWNERKKLMLSLARFHPRNIVDSPEA